LLTKIRLTIKKKSPTAFFILPFKFPGKKLIINNAPRNQSTTLSTNGCPCGYLTDKRKECHCRPLQIQNYLAKISGPLLDRIDIHLEVPALPPTALMSPAACSAENSPAIKERTIRARSVQLKRFQGLDLGDKTRPAAGNGAIYANAQMNQKQIKQFCSLTKESRQLLHKAIEELGFSARAYDKILKVSRTIADTENSGDILPAHIAEAIQYRCLDRGWWG